MSDWIEEALEEKDETEHQWLQKGNGSIGYYSFYCPKREIPYGFGSEREFSYCPHCGEELDGSI